MAEACVGVVKAHHVFRKNPTQHAADFEILHDHPSIQPLLQLKDIDCIRGDDDPSILKCSSCGQSGTSKWERFAQL